MIENTIADMKVLPLIVVLLFLNSSLSAQQSEKSVKVSSKSQLSKLDANLFGAWISDVNDKATMNSYGNVTMIFGKDGKLIYDTYEGDKLQRIFLVYRISGDTIISDQPTHLMEQKTKYRLLSKDTLILEYKGETGKFRRVGSKSK